MMLSTLISVWVGLSCLTIGYVLGYARGRARWMRRLARLQTGVRELSSTVALIGQKTTREGHGGPRPNASDWLVTGDSGAWQPSPSPVRVSTSTRRHIA